ncbi:MULTISPECIES: helix-turn-helix transcriptional regulator [unclassified Variovorax]|uniref:helix-turn-helix domain-containing protein n=1 Tax=unclassified Variovorax TaxID=663243 RepID=UPI002578A937|nr:MULTISPECIES: helix-turn-helix transcriptional regulator [unclassified Variovorax]MDM0090332.1 helix-turn-helix transcriptional regulator [Variovorax sp. J22G40]MDM0148002.1 helix-turn-helix transcriptional regulator [Variovorax sp. J2P1-31]
MKLTPFGETVRILRVRCGLSLKVMAEALGISSAHLSSIEFGEKRLLQKHVDLAIAFFEPRVSAAQVQELRTAAGQSMHIVDTGSMSADARGLVAAFARKLQEGSAPTPEMMSWLNNTSKKNVKE